MTGKQFSERLEGLTGSQHFNELLAAMLDNLQTTHPTQEMEVMIAGMQGLQNLKDAAEKVGCSNLRHDPRGHVWKLFADVIQYRILFGLGQTAMEKYTEYSSKCVNAMVYVLNRK